MATDRKALELLEAIERETLRRAGATDPVAFAQSVGVTADPWQERVLRSKSKRILLNCCRQAGKSTTFALRSLHRAIYTPRALNLIIAPSGRQSAEVLRKVQDFLGALPVPAHLNTDSKTEVALKNGSRIVSLPAGESTIRGFSAVTELIVDESGDVPDELYRAVMPMLIISRGTMLAGGTPKGRRGFFFEEWDKGGEGWDRIEAKWTDCPRMNATEIELQRASLKEKFGQEFECQFVRLTGGMVYASFSDGANCSDELPESNDWRYLLSIDFGFVDATAFVVLGWRPNDPTLYVILSFKETGLHADDIADRIRTIRATYPFGQIIGDIGGYGKGPAEELLSRFSIHIDPAPKTEKAGYIDILNGAFSRKLVKVYRPANVALVDELVALPWNDQRTNHANGYEDHLCFIAGTMVVTPGGSRPIESLRVGDSVMTRKGPRAVLAAAATGMRRIWTLETGSGRVLSGTSDHPVFTEEYGWCPIDSLPYGASLCAWEKDSCRTPKSSPSRVFGIADIPTQRSASCASTSLRNAVSDCTVQYGKTPLGQFQTVTSSTTETKIRRTTPSTIWNALRLRSTCAITWLRQSVSLLLDVLSQSHSFALPSGTLHLKAASGMPSTGAPFGKRSPTSGTSASSAVARSRQERSAQTSAQTSALQSSGATAESMTSTGCASNASLCSGRTSTIASFVARDHVQRVRRTARVASVYALTVADEHEYFANDILVSNCDGLLYGHRVASAYLQKPLVPRPTAPEVVIPEQTAAVWREHEEQMRKGSQEHYDVGDKLFSLENFD